LKNGLQHDGKLHAQNAMHSTVLHCVSKKTSPTFSTVTWKPIIRFW